MNNNIRKAYSEIYEILKLLDDELVNKLPKKFIEFIEKKKDNEYVVNINPNIPLEDQNLLPDTINILAMLKLDYWCANEDEKNELLSILTQNEEEYQKQLHEKYNPDKLFNRINTADEEYANEEKSLVSIKEKNFIVKLFEKLKKMFKR